MELPKLTKRKKINHKKLVRLAKIVRQSLKEEEQYLKEKTGYEDSLTGRFFLNS